MAIRLDYRRPVRRTGPLTRREATLWLGLIAAWAVIGLGLLTHPDVHSDPRRAAAMCDLDTLRDALSRFRADAGRFPTAAEGLGVLTATGRPGGPCPEQRYVTDPWRHPYVYRPVPTNGQPFDLRSAGPDGQVDTGDDILCR